MTSLQRLEILIDSAHRHAMEDLLPELNITRCVIIDRVAAHGFEKNQHGELFDELLGTTMIVAYCEEGVFKEAMEPLRKFLIKCGGALFVSPVNSLRA